MGSRLSLRRSLTSSCDCECTIARSLKRCLPAPEDDKELLQAADGPASVMFYMND